VTQVIKQAEKYYPHIIKIGIFGSYSRNEHNDSSDLDVIIDYDNYSEEFMESLECLMDELELAFNGKIDYVTVPGLMNSNDEEFKQEVLTDVQWIYDGKNMKQDFTCKLKN